MERKPSRDQVRNKTMKSKLRLGWQRLVDIMIQQHKMRWFGLEWKTEWWNTKQVWKDRAGPRKTWEDTISRTSAGQDGAGKEKMYGSEMSSWWLRELECSPLLPPSASR